MPAGVRLGVGAQLAALDQLARLAGGRRFSAQPRACRENVLARLDRLPSVLGDATLPLQLLPLTGYLAQPQVTRALGVEPLPAGALPPVVRLPVRRPADLGPGFTEAFDVVIVGSGAGGAPVARELARAGWSVAVVEEGDAFTREDFTGPEVDRAARLYRDGGVTATVGRPSILMPMGRAVGGTTVVNSGTCLRTPARIVGSWREAFGVALGPEDLAPFYEDVEATLGVAPVPWEVMGNNGRVAHRGAEALGISGRPLDRNAGGCRGSGVCAVGCPVDGKRGTHLNYLPQAAAAGTEILARCRVDRILRSGRRAVGVSGALLDERGHPVGPFTLRARRGVVVSAGAVMTPVLLARSGHRGSGLGRNLRIHPDTAVLGLFDERIDGWKGVLQSYLVDALAHRGILLESTFPPPGLSYQFAALRLTPMERKDLLARLGHMAILGLLVSDTSSGRVIGLGRGRTPLMRYRLNDFDADRIREGMLLAARILFAAGATEVHPMLRGAGVLHSPDEAAACLRRPWPPTSLHCSAYHPMGTARMGSDPGSVVDDGGSVHGAERLAVADASVFPTSLAVNPQVTIMAFATRAARRILERW